VEWLSRTQARLGEMLSLIHDWLALARIERGSPCEPGAVADLAAVLEGAVEAARLQAQPAGVTVISEVGPGLGAVLGDEVSIDTVVANLLNNAIKYNRVGGTVAVKAARDGDTAVLEVADTGIGIPEDALPGLFTEFYRVKNEHTRDIPGTGLGLAICRRIVADLGGSIEVHSKVDAGTTFVVRLPAPQPAGRPDERTR